MHGHLQRLLPTLSLPTIGSLQIALEADRLRLSICQRPPLPTSDPVAAPPSPSLKRFSKPVLIGLAALAVSKEPKLLLSLIGY
jgi:hypothetical protein